jgi:hypothetical protein
MVISSRGGLIKGVIKEVKILIEKRKEEMNV